MFSIDAEKLAKELIDRHIPGWSFDWILSQRVFGKCRYRTSTILLSLPLVQRNSEDLVRNTILHEIAHALTPWHNHDHVWKSKCIEIGAPPERCFNSNVVDTGAEITATCSCPGKVFKWVRMPRRQYRCRICKQALVPHR
jgi:predicted SprT family Zn-dependent metalloprotease